MEATSRVSGWRNAEVLAHLAAQPVLLARFLADAGSAEAPVRLAENLAGTHALASTIDIAARHGAEAGKTDFARQAGAVGEVLGSTDVTATVTTMQGPIKVGDYLRTRCVEAVVHGMDLRPPIAPDPVALTVAVDALMTVLPERSPLLAERCHLPAETFLEVSTGRAPAPAALAEVMPLMS